MRENFGKMQEEPINASCSRAEDLIAYLYGEASEHEANEFERHLHDCASCRAELSAFAGVRESVGLWRHQVLGAFEAFESKALAAPSLSRRRSALAALREFFSLSPAWMQAATALAALAFVALMGVAVLHFSRPNDESASIKPLPQQTGYTQQQVDEMVANARREEQEAARAAQTSSTQNKTIAANATEESSAPRVNRSSKAAAPKLVYVAGRSKKSARPLTQQEFNEIVRGYQLTASNDEERAPRLSDLLRDTNGSN